MDEPTTVRWSYDQTADGAKQYRLVGHDDFLIEQRLDFSPNAPAHANDWHSFRFGLELGSFRGLRAAKDCVLDTLVA
jgi:hypothetical protein